MWDMWALVILIYTVVVAPLRLGFMIDNYCPEGIWVRVATPRTCPVASHACAQ